MRFLLAPALLLLLGLAACGNDPVVFDVDVSRSHTPRDVNWPEPEFEDLQLKPIASVRIKLPGGAVFAPAAPIASVIMNRDGENLHDLAVTSEKMSSSAAYALANRWAKQFDLDTRGLDDWYEKRRRGGDPLERAQAGGFEPRLGGEDGPVPIVQINYSADEQLPSLVVMEFAWKRDFGAGPGL